MGNKGSSVLLLTLSVLFLFCMCKLSAATTSPREPGHRHRHHLCKRTVQPKRDLDLPKFMGRWYVHKIAVGVIKNGTNTTNSYATESLPIVPSSCIQSDLSFRGRKKNRLEAKFKYLTTKEGKAQIGNTVLNISIPHVNEPAIWTIHANVTVKNIVQRITTESVIYATDHKTFAVLYQCTVIRVNGTAIGAAQANVWTRKREVTKTMDSFLDNLVLGLGFKKEYIIPIDQSAPTCKSVTE